MKLTLSVLPEKLGICHFDKNSLVPGWAQKGTKFYSITKAGDELSVVCDQDNIPAGVLFEKDWRCFGLESVVDGVYSVGIIAVLAKPLADNGISIFNISTYGTNYLLVEDKNLEKAVKILSEFCDIK